MLRTLNFKFAVCLEKAQSKERRTAELPWLEVVAIVAKRELLCLRGSIMRFSKEHMSIAVIFLLVMCAALAFVGFTIRTAAFANTRESTSQAGSFEGAVFLEVQNLADIAKRANGEEIPFEVSAVMPESQLDPESGYFDLLVEPNSTHDLTLKVENRSDHYLTLAIVPQNGTTSNTGYLDYTGAGELLEEGMFFCFTDVCSPKQVLDLAPGEESLVQFLVAIPSVSFEGTVLGALQVFEITDRSLEKDEALEGFANTGDMSSKDESVPIENRYSYIAGVVLQANLEKVEPRFYFGKVAPATWNARFAIQGELKLPVPTIVKNYMLEGRIISRESFELVEQFEPQMFSMAPNSIYAFHSNVRPEAFPPGSYTLQMSIWGEGQEWELDAHFVVSPQQRNMVLAQTIESDEAVFMTGGVMAVMLLLASCLAIFYRLRIRRR